MKGRKSTIITVIVVILLAVAVVAGYFIVSSKKASKNYEEELEKTEVDKLMEKDLENNYPPTAREVVKLYSRILKCYYNEKLSEEALEGLLDQMRKLYDEEFLAENPREVHLEELKEEIKDFEARSCTVTSYQVEQNANIITWTDEGKDYARIIVAFTEKEGKYNLKVFEEFILRKDEKNQWKILGWRLADENDMN